MQISFRQAAGKVWRNKARAEALDLFLNEETITESVLLFLALRHQGTGIRIKPYTKSEEKKSGTDWEWWFGTPVHAVGMRIQAKRLFPDSTYRSLETQGNQTKTLIGRAGNLFPAFVFYNDENTASTEIGKLSHNCSCLKDFRGPSYWGCTFAGAEEVFKENSNELSRILSISMPWHCLLCPHATSQTNLADRVAANLNAGAINSDTKGHDLHVRPSKPPSWVGELIVAKRQTAADDSASEGIPRIAAVDSYIKEHSLAGVTIFYDRDNH